MDRSFTQKTRYYIKLKRRFEGRFKNLQEVLQAKFQLSFIYLNYIKEIAHNIRYYSL